MGDMVILWPLLVYRSHMRCFRGNDQVENRGWENLTARLRLRQNGERRVEERGGEERRRVEKKGTEAGDEDSYSCARLTTCTSSSLVLRHSALQTPG